MENYPGIPKIPIVITMEKKKNTNIRNRWGINCMENCQVIQKKFLKKIYDFLPPLTRISEKL